MCQAGYWLCQDQALCVLQGLVVRGTFFSNLCDGQPQCEDGSDEDIYQCLQVSHLSKYDKRIPHFGSVQVHFYKAALCTVFLVVVLPFLLALLYRNRELLKARVVSLFTKHVDPKGKTYHEVGFT